MTNETNTIPADEPVPALNGHPVLDDTSEATYVQDEEAVGGTEVKPEGVTVH